MSRNKVAEAFFVTYSAASLAEKYCCSLLRLSAGTDAASSA